MNLKHSDFNSKRLRAEYSGHLTKFSKPQKSGISFDPNIAINKITLCFNQKMKQIKQTTFNSL